MCLEKSDFSLASAETFAKDIIRRNAEKLLAGSVTDGEAFKEILQTMPQLQSFSSTMLPNTNISRPSSSNKATMSHQSRLPYNNSQYNGQSHAIKGATYGRDASIRFEQVHMLEESTVSPELGLKGSIDVTMMASIDQKSPAIVGIEFKTGHKQTAQPSHVAQLNMYTLMLRGKYGTASSSTALHNTHAHATARGASYSGVLLYLNDKGQTLYNVSPSLGEIKSLIGQRNLLAAYTTAALQPRGVATSQMKVKVASSVDLPQVRTNLPDMIQNPHSCSYCFSNHHCMLFASADIEMNRTSPTHDKFGITCNAVEQSHNHLLQHFVGHLGPQEVAYFREWDRMIDLEFDNYSKAYLLKAWRQSSQDLQDKTRSTISDMIWDANYAPPSEPDSGRVLLKFSKREAGASSLLSLNFEQGDMVVVSADADSHSKRDRRLSQVQTQTNHSTFHTRDIVRGFVHMVTDLQLYILVSGSDVAQIQKAHESCRLERGMVTGDKHCLALRIDKDEYGSGASILRQNLANLFLGGIPKYSKDKRKIQSQETEDVASIRLRQRLISLRQNLFDTTAEPRFDDGMKSHLFSYTGITPDIPGCDLMDLCAEFYDLNLDQQQAVEKVRVRKPMFCDLGAVFFRLIHFTHSPSTVLSNVT
jgi:hypothetical protein